MAIPTDALIRKNPLKFTVDSFGLLQIENTGGTLEGAHSINLCFSGVKGHMCLFCPSHESLQFINEVRFISAKIGDEWKYCKTITNSDLNGFKVLEYYDGGTMTVKDEDIEEIRFDKLVEIEFENKRWHFLIDASCVISNGISEANYKDGLGHISHDSGNLSNPQSLMHGSYRRW